MWRIDGRIFAFHLPRAHWLLAVVPGVLVLGISVVLFSERGRDPIDAIATMPSSEMERGVGRFLPASDGLGARGVVSQRLVPRAAVRDPFQLTETTPTFVRTPTPAFVPPPPVLVASAVPSEPVLQLSFSGRMQTPDGRTVVLAQWSDGRPVTLEQGKVLPNGYRVERMSEGLVELLNPQTQAVVQLPLPPTPRFETR